MPTGTGGNKRSVSWTSFSEQINKKTRGLLTIYEGSQIFHIPEIIVGGLLEAPQLLQNFFPETFEGFRMLRHCIDNRGQRYRGLGNRLAHSMINMALGDSRYLY